MVDRYWRQVENVRNDIENSKQISSILLKLKGYDEKLNDISKISTNKDNMSSNLCEVKNIKNDMTTIIRKIFLIKHILLQIFQKIIISIKYFN